MDKHCSSCVAEEIEMLMLEMHDEAQAKHLMRFFKTAPGQYGEGDKFLGIRVPVTRSIVKRFKAKATIEDVRYLTSSPWHELRLSGFLLMIELYNRKKKLEDVPALKAIVLEYLTLIDRGNNWDLVDLIAPKILGDYLCRDVEMRDWLENLADRDGCLWHQRVAVVATLALICQGDYDVTLRIVEKLMNHPHDLIHKACGWMLREVGKRGGQPLMLSFLDRHAASMPRTMLRYAIERLPQSQRLHYLSSKRI